MSIIDVKLASAFTWILDKGTIKDWTELYAAFYGIERHRKVFETATFTNPDEEIRIKDEYMTVTLINALENEKEN
ncbi:MAG: hypothetical protein KAU20_05645 [Nanoarchaeota archaeon]|nr:hypothetical protein [Nanoarchaeota archaeon]